jgi:hypothetical protein
VKGMRLSIPGSKSGEERVKVCDAAATVQFSVWLSRGLVKPGDMLAMTALSFSVAKTLLS